MSSSEAPDSKDGDGKAPVAFGFTKSIVQRKVAVAIDEPKEKRQLITGYAGSKAQTAGPQEEDETAKQKKYIVPKLENTYKTGVGKKFAPSFRPPEHDAPSIGAGTDRFEAAKEDTRPSITGYGLERRERPKEGEAPAGRAAAPDLPRLTPEQLERRAFKQDMEVLPDAPAADEYDPMPVEEFGMALLRGMGWQEGNGVGKNRRKVEPIEYLRRPERLGLGANPAALMDANAGKPKQVKMGDAPVVPKEHMVLAPGADGRTRNIRTLDEKLVPLSSLGPRAGKTMRVVGGRHAGLACVVEELLPEEKGRSARARVRLLPSHEVVDVRCSDLQEPGQAAQEPVANGRGSAGQEGSDRRGDGGQKSTGRAANGSSGRDEGGRESGGKHGSARDSQDDGRDKGRSPSAKRHRSSHQRSSSGDDEDTGYEQLRPKDVWLRPYIKVRVVDKHVRAGRLYLKKGTVVDVHPGGKCDVALDDARDQSVLLHQDQLETVIPKEVGAALMVLLGPHRGHKARLHAKSDHGACAVQMVHDFSIQRLMLDQVAMYMGSLEED